MAKVFFCSAAIVVWRIIRFVISWVTINVALSSKVACQNCTSVIYKTGKLPLILIFILLSFYQTDPCFFQIQEWERKREQELFSSSPQGVKRNTGSAVFGSVDLPEVTLMEKWPFDLQIHTQQKFSQRCILPSVYVVCL